MEIADNQETFVPTAFKGDDVFTVAIRWDHISEPDGIPIEGMAIARKSGKIINVSSMWGTSGASCEAAYSASKAGVNGLTKALAKELAPSNIQVNAVACGVIDTAMNQRLTIEERKDLEEEIPMGRFGTTDEVASIIWDIANASPYMTGQVIGIDGGYL